MITSTLRLNLGRAALIATSLIIMGAFQNCSNAKFSGSTANSASGGDANGYDDVWRDNLNQPNTNPGSCYTILHQIATDTKLIFVVDNSGSNTGAGGSDPNKQVRGGSIQAFFDDFKAKQNFWWGFVIFKGSTATPLITDAGNQGAITNMLPPMQTAIGNFMSSGDAGNTPYIAAMDEARGIVSRDTQVNNNTKWIVVFLSDGLPNPSLSDAQLEAGVKSIMDLKPGKVSFNTIYYGKTDPEASERLRKMAQTGLGKFLDTNANPSGKSFLISNVVNVPGTTTCQP